MKLMQTLPEVDIDISIQTLRSNTDVPELFKLFLRNIGTIVDFECQEFSTADQKFEEKYMLKAKLAALDLSGICDLEEYLNSGSQLEYVAKLRKSIH
jgi:Fe2+ or Zn2+ uptake regulation protein